MISPSLTTSLGDQVSPLLCTKSLGRSLHFIEKVSSTNSVALEAALSGAEHGTVFAADYQTDGYGRQGRKWSSSQGLNLTFSVILRLPVPPKKMGIVSLAACLAVSEAIAKVSMPTIPQLKWPNDILLDDQKVSGMILHTMDTSETAIILGIGINVNQTEFPEELETCATSLILVTGQPIDRAHLMASVLLQLEKFLELMVLNPSCILDLYSEKLAWIGHCCRVVGKDTDLTGTLIGIDESGGLVLDTESSGTQIFFAGDVSLRVSDH